MIQELINAYMAEEKPEATDVSYNVEDDGTIGIHYRYIGDYDKCKIVVSMLDLIAFVFSKIKPNV